MAAKLTLVTFHIAISVLLCLIINAKLTKAAVVYDVARLGAKADGKTDSSKAFLAAWNGACASRTPATIYVPRGRFYLRSATFNGPCKNNAITVRIYGTLIASSNYNAVGSSGYWIIFRQVNGVTVIGGVLDGQGSKLWACKNSGKSCPTGVTNLQFSNSNNVVVSGLTSLNSKMFHIVVNGCRNVRISGVKVSAASSSPNTDGIHVEDSTGVTILNSVISTGDDCISIGPGSSNLYIQKISCGPGHGISIGSLGKELQEAGVKNVTVKTVTFSGTQNGVRIKSWARASKGFATNILFQNVVMKNVQNPIIIDQNYCPDGSGCPNQASGVKISNVRYQDIHGTSATQVAVNFGCSKAAPCTGIKLQDVNLTYKNLPAKSSCANAGGTASGVVKPSSCL